MSAALRAVVMPLMLGFAVFRDFQSAFNAIFAALVFELWRAG